MGNKDKEKGERPNPAGFFLTVVEGEKIYCTPANSTAYLHEDPKYDHLFYRIGENEDGNQMGYYFWRSFVGGNFDLMIKYMINNGYEVENCIGISDGDYQQWLLSHDVELPTVELTDRQENELAFVRYLLDKELLTAQDFKDGGIIQHESL